MVTKFATDQPLPMKILPKGKAVPFAKVVTGCLAATSGILLGFAVPDLIDASGALDYLKAAFLAGSGGLVSYATTTLAIERGAPQAAIGMIGAKLVSATSIGVVGIGLFAATYAGLTIAKVDDLRLRQYTSDVGIFIDARDRQSSKAGRVVPVIETIRDGLADKETCEEATNCISGDRVVGRGPVTRALASKRQRAEAVAKQVQKGTVAEKDALRRVNQGLAALDHALDANELNKAERRTALKLAGAEINQGLNELDETIPTALIAAYADELQRPVVIPGKRNASDAVSNILAGYGDSLSAVLKSNDDRNKARPTFPAPTGVTDTFTYIGHFLPIAAIVAVVELVFPLTLWLFTYFTLVAQVLGSEMPRPTTTRRGRPPASATKED